MAKTTNCRFAFAVHVLSVMALKRDEPLTSQALSLSVNTNPVVIRRLLADLRAAGLVRTQRGQGGGSVLACAPTEISLCAVYRAAVGVPTLFAGHPNPPAKGCPVGREILNVLDDVAERARAAVIREYSAITLADVVRSLDKSRPRGR